MKRSLAVLCLALAILPIGCEKKPVIAVHPGAINATDSYLYDVLLVEQDAINEACAQFKAGALPPEAKEPLNSAISQFNFAAGLYRTYHAGMSGDLESVTLAVQSLIQQVGLLYNAMRKPEPRPIPAPSSRLRDPLILEPIAGL